jgi:hypothetical protein
LLDQVLERWPTLESRNRSQIACSLLARLEPGSDAGHLSDLSDAQLHARLAALLQGGDSAAGAPAASESAAVQAPVGDKVTSG